MGCCCSRKSNNKPSETTCAKDSITVVRPGYFLEQAQQEPDQAQVMNGIRVSGQFLCEKDLLGDASELVMQIKGEENHVGAKPAAESGDQVKDENWEKAPDSNGHAPPEPAAAAEED